MTIPPPPRTVPTLDRPRLGLPPELLADRRLGATAKLIAAALVTCWARVKDHCWPSDATIAARINRSPGHVQRGLRQLEQAGWIVREHTDAVPGGRRIWLCWRRDDGGAARRHSRRRRGSFAAPARRTDRHRNLRSRTRRGSTGTPTITTGAGDGPHRPARGRPEAAPRRGPHPDRARDPTGGRGPAPEFRGGSSPDSGRAGGCRPAARGPPAPPGPDAPSAGRAEDASRSRSARGAPSLPPDAPPLPAELTSRERSRLQELPEARRQQVLRWLALGDPICLAEARKLLQPPRPVRVPPATTAELLDRIAEDPTYPAQAAQRLAAEFDDATSWSGYQRCACGPGVGSCPRRRWSRRTARPRGRRYGTPVRC